MEESNQLESLLNKIQRKLDTAKEAVSDNNYPRANRNLINLANDNEELMYQCRLAMKKNGLNKKTN
ncbi:hypothetical protein KY998_04700 [Bacillus paralicheniformis]|uniref:hypothetical protein n=1 Tax=Bacillus TaxID=1386 RepID=UPI0006816BD7|nr:MULTISPECIES: hypothetical protein [Bacillus subtilis group]KND05563.1 SPBc2 prophage-derived protein YotK [Bacillus paralicheniformis]MBM6849460.1 hypothetical protein [Bacillus licheniformis]MED1237909.1 hypothetical protein [Bacillus paralicheniformis]OJT64867.1 hypothetical protein BFP49_06235 [Bacillus licheniformis]UAL16190.1 hypothetical protein KY997_11935 [Bacillus paralicheniformis]